MAGADRSNGHEVLFTISDDGRIGMFPSAEAIESALAPSDTEQTRIFMEDARELEVGAELTPSDGSFFRAPYGQYNNLATITTVLMPNEETHDVDFLRRSLVYRFGAETPINTAMPLADVVDAVKHHLSYGFH